MCPSIVSQHQEYIEQICVFFSREIARVLFLKNNLAISRKKYFSQPINNNESDPCIFLCDINQSNNDFFHNDSN